MLWNRILGKNKCRYYITEIVSKRKTKPPYFRTLGKHFCQNISEMNDRKNVWNIFGQIFGVFVREIHFLSSFLPISN